MFSNATPRHAQQRRSVRCGFTLLEVVAALAVISLVAVSALAAVAQQLNVAARATMIARAQELAAQRYASLRLLSSAQLRTIPDSAANGHFPSPNQGFVWHITQTPLLNDLYLSDVQIDVRWPDGVYTLRTRIYAPGGDTLP